MDETTDKKTVLDVEPSKSRHKKWVFASNASFQLPQSIMGAVQVGFLVKYYETVIGLDVWLIFLATTIFMFYDAFNDPLIGFLVDRNMKFTRKWGRRFPWLAVGIVPWCLSVFLIFSAPDLVDPANPWLVFGWLILSLLIYDTFGSLVVVNNSALRPDLFRTEEERRKFAKYYTPIDMVAVVLGILLPAIFIDPNSANIKADYNLMGLILAIVSLIFALLYLPSAREDKVMIDRYYTSEYVQMNFIKNTKEALKLKSFQVFILFTIFYGISIAILTNNMIYLTTYVLQASSTTYILIMAIYLMGTLIYLTFWLKYIEKKKDNKQAFVVGSFAFCTALIPLTFHFGILDLLIMGFILGFANGCVNAFIFTILYPMVIDDFVVKTRKNQKGVLLGIFSMLHRLTSSIHILIFAIVHSLTGFKAGYETYVDMAAAGVNMEPVIIGTRLLTGVIPAVALLIGTVIFWKFFPITQEIMVSNKAELEKLTF